MLVMVAQAFILTLRKQRQMELYEFEGSLIDRASSRTASCKQWDPAPKNKTKQNYNLKKIREKQNKTKNWKAPRGHDLSWGDAVLSETKCLHGQMSLGPLFDKILFWLHKTKCDVFQMYHPRRYPALVSLGTIIPRSSLEKQGSRNGVLLSCYPWIIDWKGHHCTILKKIKNHCFQWTGAPAHAALRTQPHFWDRLGRRFLKHQACRRTETLMMPSGTQETSQSSL